MAEQVSPALQIMRDELAAQRERRNANRAGMARILAGCKLTLKRGRALVLTPTSPPTPVESPSPRPPPAPHPEPVASRMALGAWSDYSSRFADPNLAPVPFSAPARRHR
jgi:hypothetical protein